MLTGNTPWTGRTETELKTKMKTVPIKNILPPAISKISASFLLKALESDSRKRMDIPELFSHFDGGYEQYGENYEAPDKNRLFRSMRKTKRNTEFETNRG